MRNLQQRLRLWLLNGSKSTPLTFRLCRDNFGRRAIVCRP
nr:MAG TPA: hypothetical protein [Caudoviricetes sp.]